MYQLAGQGTARQGQETISPGNVAKRRGAGRREEAAKAERLELSDGSFTFHLTGEATLSPSGWQHWGLEVGQQRQHQLLSSPASTGHKALSRWGWFLDRMTFNEKPMLAFIIVPEQELKRPERPARIVLQAPLWLGPQCPTQHSCPHVQPCQKLHVVWCTGRSPPSYSLCKIITTGQEETKQR